MDIANPESDSFAIWSWSETTSGVYGGSLEASLVTLQRLQA